MDSLGTSTSTTTDTLCAYQLRVDAPQEAWSHAVIESFIKEFNVERFLISHEIGEKTKKPHYQGIIYTKKELKDNCRNKIRYYFKTRIKAKTRQPVSITKAKNIQSLEAYCMKTGNIRLTNYTKGELSDIPEWQDKDNFKRQIIKLLEDSKPTNVAFARRIVRTYINNDKQPPSKQMIYKYLLKSKRMSTAQYLREIGMFGEWSTAHDYDDDSDSEAD